MNDSIPLPKKLLMIGAEDNCGDQPGAIENTDSRLAAQTMAGDEAVDEIIFDRYKKLVVG